MRSVPELNGAAAPTATTLSLVDTNPTNGQTAIVTFTPLTDANLLDTDATNDVVAVALPERSLYCLWSCYVQ